MPKELYQLEPLGVCAVKGTLSAIRALQARADDLQRQARRALEAAAQEREDLLDALSLELGVSFPSACRFRLQGSTIEVMWEGEPAAAPVDLGTVEAQPVKEAETVEETEAQELTAAAG